MSEHHCTSCTRPATDAAAICHICTDEAARLLRGARVLIVELRTTIAKLDRRTPPGLTASGHERSLIYDVHAARVLSDFADCIRGWASSVGKLEGLSSPITAWATPDRNDTASWLVAQLPVIRRHEFAATMLADLRRHTARALKEIDLPAQTVFLGPCATPVDDGTCQAAVYAPLGRAEASCHSCGARHNVSERREWLLASLEELRVTAATARKLALYLGVDIGQSTIVDWRKAERIQALSPTEEEAAAGRDVYRFGDILGCKRQLVAQRAGDGVAA